MEFKIDELLTIVFTLFAVIDIVGSIPLLIAMKEKSGAIQSLKVTLISGGLMILFLFLGKPFLQLLGWAMRFLKAIKMHSLAPWCQLHFLLLPEAEP